MTDKKTSNKLSAQPVIYVHAKGRGQGSETQVRALLELGLPLCSRLAYDGITQTNIGFDQPGLLLAELAELFPGRPVIFLRAGLQPSKYQLDQLTGLLEQTNLPLALSLLSNAETALNPFSGLQAPAQSATYDLADLVGLLAPGQLHTLTAWTDHFVLLSADLVTHLSAENFNGTLMQQIRAADGLLKVPDHLFLHDPDNRVFTALKLQPHETAHPPPFSELTSRLQDWLMPASRVCH